MDPADTITQLLTEHSKGRREALDEMFPVLYDELRKIARGYMRREGKEHTLQPTAVVHEAYFKLLGQRQVDFRNRAQFLGVAAKAMRRFLIDYARRRNAQARGGDLVKVPIDEALDAGKEREFDLLALDLALEELATLNDRHARLVELRYFAGLTIEEAEEVLGVDRSTLVRDWRMARAWLYTKLAGEARIAHNTVL